MFYLAGIFLSKQITEIGQILLIIPTFVAVYDNYKEKTLSLPKSTYWLIAFLVLAFLSLWINAEYVDRPSRHLYALRAPLYGIFGVYIFRYWIKRSSDQAKAWTLNIFFVSLLISSVYGIYRYIDLDQKRLEGLVNTMKQGYGFALILSLLISALLHKQKIKNFFNPKIGSVVLVTLIIVLVLTFTRGALLGLVCSLPLIIFFYKKKWGYYCGVITFLAVTLLGSYYIYGTKNFDIRYLSTKNNNSDSKRRSVWEAALYGAKERPLTGWGYQNLKYNMKGIKERNNLSRPDFHATAHNIFLEVVSGIGILGLMTFLGWLITWGIELWRGEAILKKIILPFLITFIISGQFETIIDHRLAIVVFTIYSLSVALKQESRQRFIN